MRQQSCLDCGTPSNDRRCPNCRRRRARERKALGLTGERGSTRAGRARRERVLAKARHRCFYCRAKATVEEHFIPLSRGGDDSEVNLVAACAPCNQAKGEQLPGEFLAADWLKRRQAEVRSASNVAGAALAQGGRKITKTRGRTPGGSFLREKTARDLGFS